MEVRRDARPAVLAAALTRARPPLVPLTMAFVLGLAYGIELFGMPGSAESQAFWRLPEGLLGSALDIRTHVSGYWWFVLDRWRWPLLALENPNWPRPSNAALFDLIPPVALLGKALRTVFGIQVNLFPWWCVGSIALNAVALAAVVRALGRRSVLAALLAGGLGAMAPAVQFRFGHSALLGHFVFVFAMALYFAWERRHVANRVAFAAMVGLCLLSAMVHLYLYVITAAIVGAAVLQAVVARRLSIVAGLLVLGCILISAFLPLWAFGLFDGWNLAGVEGETAKYSMNLLMPFWPQSSGLFGWTGIYWLTRGSIGATPGQYDGFNYLGGGALLLVGVAAVLRWRDVWPFLRRHWSLALALSVLTVWALSERVYLGPLLVAAYEVPDLLRTTVMAWFRSSGRLFWPVGWLLFALGVAGVLATLRPRAAVAVAALVLALQWIDVAPLRGTIIAAVGQPSPSVFGSPAAAAAVEARIAAAGSVVVVPSIFCSSAAGDFGAPMNLAAAEVQLMAARGNARMPWVYLSRVEKPCGGGLPEELTARAVIVELNDVNLENYAVPVGPGKTCVPFALGRVCY